MSLLVIVINLMPRLIYDDDNPMIMITLIIKKIIPTFFLFFSSIAIQQASVHCHLAMMAQPLQLLLPLCTKKRIKSKLKCCNSVKLILIYYLVILVHFEHQKLGKTLTLIDLILTHKSLCLAR